MIAAILHAQAGNAFQAERWLDAAERAARDVPAPDGSTSIRAWVATASALICRNGVKRMRRDAELAVAELAPLSPLRGPAVWMLAVALLLDGDPDADARLEEAADAAEATGAVFAGVCAHAQRAILALEHGDVDAARSLISKAQALLAAGRFQDYLATALLVVADARLEIRAGEEARARRHLAEAQRLRPYMTRAIPYYSVKTLAEMSRAYLDLGDANAARAVLMDATEVLRERPDLGTLGSEVGPLRERAAVASRVAGWESSLTAAELRLLPLLTTHLTFREIGQRLAISRNTVKTQAISIYRKLAVTSRSAAVQRAEELGLVESSHRA